MHWNKNFVYGKHKHELEPILGYYSQYQPVFIIAVEKNTARWGCIKFLKINEGNNCAFVNVFL